MLSVLASLALLAAMGALGIALLVRFAQHLRPLEWFAYGAPLGMVIGTLALVPVSTLIGFRAVGVVGVGLGCALVAVLLLRRSPPIPRPDPRRISWLPTIVIGAFAVRWAFFWRDAVTVGPDGMFAGHINLWGDWPVHIGIVSSFVDGANFPPEHPRFAGHAFAYHYLSDLTAAAQVTLGMDIPGALSLHSYILCVFVAIGLYAFARRFTRNTGAATLAVVLFLLGGGLGWVATAAAVEHSHDLLGTLSTLAWDRHVKSDLNMQFVNMFFGFLASQRAFLYGLPLAFAIVSTLLVAVRRADVRLFVLAGVIAGLLPLAHLPTLLALAIVTPVLVVLFPSRAWAAYFAVWIAVALPQLLPQLGGGPGALSFIRLAAGLGLGARLVDLVLAEEPGLVRAAAAGGTRGAARAARARPSVHVGVHDDLRGGQSRGLPAVGLGRSQAARLLVPGGRDRRRRAPGQALATAPGRRHADAHRRGPRDHAPVGRARGRRDRPGPEPVPACWIPMSSRWRPRCARRPIPTPCSSPAWRTRIRSRC